ncbi:MAG: CPBP family intramembrane glutamic endopeptidase [Bryobacteraceae bacterium]|jgi:membrane protease YdiL (CAAX protease family)
MRYALKVLDARPLVRAGELKPTVILILSALLVTVHSYFGSMKFALGARPAAGPLEAALYMFLTAFLLLGALPALVAAGFGERLTDYGIQLGDWKTGMRAILILFPAIAVLLLYPASQTAEMRAFYPLASQLLPLELARVIFFYTAWEFFFRGFMLFGLRERVGDWLAICIQTVPSCLWHIGCPTGEIVSSIAGGVLFGLLAIRTKSIVWPWLLHCLIGVGLDFFIVATK